MSTPDYQWGPGDLLPDDNYDHEDGANPMILCSIWKIGLKLRLLSLALNLRALRLELPL